MEQEYIKINNIPALIWGDPSDKVYIFIHGKMSRKEEAEGFALIAATRGYQVISFDLPEHGERIHENYPCHIQNGVNDLAIVSRYVNKRWKKISLFACSLGAYFSLMAYSHFSFEKCLFLSPILDMERLIKNMMQWFNVNEEQLEREREIPTPMGEILSWDYYRYVKENPVIKWDSPTYILYGTSDNLTERIVLDAFAKKFNCHVEFVNNGEHYFQSEEQIKIFNSWVTKTL